MPWSGTYVQCVHPCIFSSIHHLLTCNLGQAYTKLPDQIKNQVSPVKISDDRLMFTQSDMDISKFGVDEKNKTVLMDFGEIKLLPETLVAYTMYTHTTAASLPFPDPWICQMIQMPRWPRSAGICGRFPTETQYVNLKLTWDFN